MKKKMDSFSTKIAFFFIVPQGLIFTTAEVEFITAKIALIFIITFVPTLLIPYFLE